MGNTQTVRGFFLSLLLALGISIANVITIYADPISDPQREIRVIENYIGHQWWLLTWIGNELACEFTVDHESLPSNAEILELCGYEIYGEWFAYPVCPPAQSGGDVSSCEGLYLHYMGSQNAEREVVVKLPQPEVWISLVGCSLVAPNNLCPEIPALHLRAFEPLEEEYITQIHYRIDDNQWNISDASHEFTLSETHLEGQQIFFWADSSFGDSSPIVDAIIRVLPAENGKGWYVDVLSAQWEGEAPTALALDWGALPKPGEGLQWLSTPSAYTELATDEPYYYLAGQLIQSGVVDANECWDGGLETASYASQCGLEMAWDNMVTWQNQFDRSILSTSQETQIPAFLLKNLIAKESQFWPGHYELSPYEYGLGRLTAEGVDTLLRWNNDFFSEFCPEVLWDVYCVDGYAQLEPNLQAMLRAGLALSMDASCPSCPLGINVEHLDRNIDVIAQSLLANATQVGQIIKNLTGQKPGELSNYEDLWRFTLVNYNVGPGCFSEALKGTLAHKLPLEWQQVSAQLKGDCSNAMGYVSNVTREK